jgi:serine/threonine protein phosphatase PrpC
MIQAVFERFRSELLEDPALAVGRDLPPGGELLVTAIRLANRRIHNLAQTDSGKSGMGTTVVAAAFEDDYVSIAHVGDSRAYRLDEEQLTPLTTDHSWVEEMQKMHNMSATDASSLVGRNVITRALGVRKHVQIDYRQTKVKPGDIFILCSDGLCGFADDDEIFRAARPVRDKPRKIAEQLVQLANDRGGSDNVTVVAVRVDAVSKSKTDEVEPFTVETETAELLETEDRWLEKMQPFFDGDDDKPPSSGSKGSRLPLILIFLAFVVVAVVLVLTHLK